mmetsp:Transcript_32267/g.31686  ORF Transcript_32267/g.31686 Transcript_32267/m.31686 type:complete len:293 (+) Transcript_32267:27-905(+)
MNFFMQKDPIQEHIDSILSQCDYGVQRANVATQCKNFLQQYPQFEMTANQFTYAGMSGGTPLVYLKGAMILTVDNTQHEVPMHFVLPSGFPSIAPKAFLTNQVDEEIIKDNPYVLKNMEILNQYMNNWKSNHPSYTLNITYYYIYQSFMLCPPLNSSITHANSNLEEEKKVEEPPRQHQANGGDGEEGDKEFKKILLLSKIQEKIDKMSKLVKKFSVISVTLSQNADIIAAASDKVCTKNALLESWINIDLDELSQFIENNQGKDINDIDEIVKPEDDVSKSMLELLADETA